LRNGADLATVGQVLGHESVDVTANFYARWADDELRQRHNEFSWLNGE
jgi:integrase